MNSKKVLVFGGTHGNEWTGVYVVNTYGDMLKKEFPLLDLQFIHANPEAFKINRRFKDEDLNRAFQFLHENRPHSYEHQRAKEIKTLIDSSECFVVDLHTTTSNMGSTIIITRDHPLNFFIADQLSKKLHDTRIIFSPDPGCKYLASQSPFGMMIEVGPVANGVLKGLTLNQTLESLKEILGQLSTLTNLTTGSLEIYEEIEDVYYPQNATGELSAFIHPGFEGKDFIPVEGEYHAFMNFKGESMAMKTKELMYPIFINEAAYYTTKLAYTLCRRRTLNY